MLTATKAEEAALERIAGLPASSELGQIILKELRLAAESGEESEPVAAPHQANLRLGHICAATSMTWDGPESERPWYCRSCGRSMDVSEAIEWAQKMFEPKPPRDFREADRFETADLLAIMGHDKECERRAPRRAAAAIGLTPDSCRCAERRETADGAA